MNTTIKFNTAEINLNTPALLFPAISLIMLAYTNRFLALSNRVRSLHAKYLEETGGTMIHGQIKNLKYRLRIIKNMEALGTVFTFSCPSPQVCSLHYAYCFLRSPF